MSDAPAPAPAPAPDPITIETRDQAVIARVNLKLFDDKNVKAMNELIDQAAGKSGVVAVVLDMSRVQIMPSLGLGALIQLSRQCKSRNQRLKLAAVQPQVRQAMSITKLDNILDLVDTVEAGTA
ncbi:MAG TPA: anti-sigma factor antagonist [Tepidisphaeraceae bacterium]|nr:anti-sigma factor antagonist [Tepidisphaeraceae bacterium]